MASSSYADEFPLHWAVWHNDLERLRDGLERGAERELRDPRGRTAMLLAVTLGRMECTRVLLEHDADANAENSGYWSVCHEAVASGDPEILQLVLQHRDFQRSRRTRRAMSNLLQKLQGTPDFYAEMRWEFNSWLPFVSKLCPSDTYRVFKSGSCVRVDTTLIGFDSSNQWQRGDQSYLFKFHEEGERMEVLVLDHIQKTVFREALGVSSPEQPSGPSLEQSRPSVTEVAARLTSPIVTTFVDVDKIAFERSKAGFLSWKSDKEEEVNGYPCQVFSASQVELVTKTRTEHLTERDKTERETRNSTPMDSLLKFVQGAETREQDRVHSDLLLSFNPNGISPEEYFNAYVELGPQRDIGRPKQTTVRRQSFKAHLWLAKEFPLSLQDQITPIIDLMATNNAHFSRLKNFIELQLPSGFPVKIEIPLFHVINAKITFGNVNAVNVAVEQASVGVDGQCHIRPELFLVPASYRLIGQEVGAGVHGRGEAHGWDGQAEDDILLQWAIEQSILNDEQSGDSAASTEDVQQLTLAQVMELSRREEEQRQHRLAQEEEDVLQKAIQLSLVDK